MPTKDLGVKVSFDLPSKTVAQQLIDTKYGTGRDLKLPVGLKLSARAISNFKTEFEGKTERTTLKLPVELTLTKKEINSAISKFNAEIKATDRKIKMQVTPDISVASLKKFEEATRLALLGRPLNIPVNLDFRAKKIVAESAAAGALAGKAFNDASSRTSVGVRFSGSQLKPIASIFDPKNVAAATILGGGIIALGGAFAIAARQGALFSKELQSAAAFSGASNRELESLRSTILSLGKISIGPSFSPVELASAAKEAAKAGLTLRDTAEVLPSATILAGLGDIGLEESVLTLSKTLNIYSLEASEAQRATKSLLGASLTTQASVKDISDAFIRAVPNLKILRVGIEETSGALALLAKNGVIGATAGTQLSNFVQKITGNSKVVQAELERLDIDPFAGKNRSFIGLSTFVERYAKALKGATEEERAYSTQALAGIGPRGGRNALLVLIDEFNKGNTISGAVKAFDDSILSVIDSTRNLQDSGTRVKNTFLSVFADIGSSSKFLRPLTEGLDTLQIRLADPKFTKNLEKILNPAAIGAKAFIPIGFDALERSLPFFENLSEQVVESVGPIRNLANGVADLAAGFGSGFTIGMQSATEVLGNFGRVASAIPEVIQRIGGQAAGGFFVGKLLRDSLTIPKSAVASLEAYGAATQRVTLSQVELTAAMRSGDKVRLTGALAESAAATRSLKGLSTTMVQANRVASGLSRSLPGLGIAIGVLGDQSEDATKLITSLYLGLEAFYGLQALTGTLQGLRGGIAGLGGAAAAAGQGAAAVGSIGTAAAGAAGAATGLAGTLGTAVPIVGGILAAGAVAFTLFSDDADEASASVKAFGDEYVRVKQTLVSTGVVDVKSLAEGLVSQVKESSNFKELDKFLNSKKNALGSPEAFFQRFADAAVSVKKDIAPTVELFKVLNAEGKGARFFRSSTTGPAFKVKGEVELQSSLTLDEALTNGLSEKELAKLVKAKVTGKKVTVDIGGVEVTSEDFDATGLQEDVFDVLSEAYKKSGEEGILAAIENLNSSDAMESFAIEETKRLAKTLSDAQNTLFPQLFAAGLRTSELAADNEDAINTLLEPYQLKPKDQEAFKQAFSEQLMTLRKNIEDTVRTILPDPVAILDTALNEDGTRLDLRVFKTNIETALKDFQEQINFGKGLVALGLAGLGETILKAKPEIAKKLMEAIKAGQLTPEELKQLNDDIGQVPKAFQAAVDGLISDPTFVNGLATVRSSLLEGLSLSGEEKTAAATQISQDLDSILKLVGEMQNPGGTSDTPAPFKTVPKVNAGTSGFGTGGILGSLLGGAGTPTVTDIPTITTATQEDGAKAGAAYITGVISSLSNLSAFLTPTVIAQFSSAANESTMRAIDFGRLTGSAFNQGVLDAIKEGTLALTATLQNVPADAVTVAAPTWTAKGSELGKLLAEGVNSSFSSSLRIASIVNAALAKIQTNVRLAVPGGTTPAARQGAIVNFPNRNSGLMLLHHGEGILPPETMRALGQDTFEAMRTRAWLPNRRIGERVAVATAANAGASISTSNVSNVSRTINTSAPSQTINQTIQVTAPQAADPNNFAVSLASRLRGHITRIPRTT